MFRPYALVTRISKLRIACFLFLARIVGGFLTLSPELCFVIEEGYEIVGYALAALNAKQFHQKLKAAWIPEMCVKYPEKVDEAESTNISPPQVRKFVSYN